MRPETFKRQEKASSVAGTGAEAVSVMIDTMDLKNVARQKRATTKSGPHVKMAANRRQLKKMGPSGCLRIAQSRNSGIEFVENSWYGKLNRSADRSRM
jgi:hypothetical protein